MLTIMKYILCMFLFLLPAYRKCCARVLFQTNFSKGWIIGSDR